MGIRGIDTDNYDGAVTLDTFKQLEADHQMHFAIVGTQRFQDGRNYTGVQKSTAQAAGWVVPAHYDFLYWNDVASLDLDRMKYCASFGLPVLVDCETERGDWFPEQYFTRMAQAREVLIQEGRFGGWYSRAEWWNRVLGPYQDRFAGDIGWGANWPWAGPNGGQLPPLEEPLSYNPIQFGGLKIQTWQFSDACWGHPNFDMNYVDSPWWEVEVPTPAPLPDVNILLSIAAARFDLIDALAQGRLVARHNDDKSAVIVVDPSIPGGHDITDWIPLKKGG